MWKQSWDYSSSERKQTTVVPTPKKKTNIIDMRDADVHITLWYNKDVTEYSSTSAVFNS